jgi:archaea-specific DNA-binding protein
MGNIEMSKKSSDSNVIYVGRKLPMDYVLAIVTAFSGAEVKEVTVKARGRSITTAVDAVEITRRKFVKEMNVDKVAIGTEEMPPREGESNSRNISTIDITLKRS